MPVLLRYNALALLRVYLKRNMDDEHINPIFMYTMICNSYLNMFFVNQGSSHNVLFYENGIFFGSNGTGYLQRYI